MFSNCSTPFRIIPQSQLKDFPCNEFKSGVNLRIKNAGKVSFTELEVLFDNKNILFPGLKKGDSSCYKNIPFIWSNNSLDVLFSKQQGFTQTLMLLATDHIGETKIEHGYVTISVIVIKFKGQLKASTQLLIDKN